MNPSNVVYRKNIKSSDENSSITICLTLEANIYMIVAEYNLYEPASKSYNTEDRALRLFYGSERDFAIEQVVEIGAMSFDKITSLRHLRLDLRKAYQ